MTLLSIEKPELSQVSAHYWIFGIIIFLLSVLAFSRVFYGHLISDRLGAYTASRYLKQLIRKELVLYHPYSLITLLLFSMATSLVLLKAFHLFSPQVLTQAATGIAYRFNDFQWFLMGTGVVLIWIVGRAFAFKLVEFLIGNDYGQTENRYRLIIFNQVCGYALIPLVSIAYFIREPLDKWLILACLGLLLLNYLYRLAQSLITAFNYSANLLYLFLYLCTLEFVPLLIIGSMVLKETGLLK
ncbi:MAG TPA: DUF4271 domain-containing protein [Flavobacteriales bacterium]|nr:DUF4271 domain-containing protein [Flavobacteriales bacterium]